MKRAASLWQSNFLRSGFSAEKWPAAVLYFFVRFSNFALKPVVPHAFF
jgi:hypothetical protein